MRTKLLIPILLVVSLSTLSFAQQQTAFGDVALYKAVLDELFRTDLGNFADQGKADEIVLRFSSSSSRELQIAITERKAQAPVYRLWRVPKDQPSIWDQVAEISLRLRTEDPKKVAAAIHLEQKALDQPTERLRQLTKGFSQLRFPLSFNRGLIMDAAGYDLWFDSLSNSTHFSLQGSLHGQPSDHPLILWMIAIRSEVDKLLLCDR